MRTTMYGPINIPQFTLSVADWMTELLKVKISYLNTYLPLTHI